MKREVVVTLTIASGEGRRVAVDISVTVSDRERGDLN